MEAVLLSISPAYIAVWEKKTPKVGMRLRQLKDNVERPLAAILSLNTIAHTVGATGAGAQATHVYGDAYIGLFSGVLTLLILVLSEIIPKGLGARYWRELAPIVAGILRPLIVLLWPFVVLAEFLGGLISKQKTKPVFHHDELAALAEIGWREGAMGESELRVLKSLIRFRSLRASDIKTPRTVVCVLPQSLTIEDTLQKAGDTRFSRIPLYENGIDDIKGYVLKDDILLHASMNSPKTRLLEIKRNLIVVPNLISVPQLFETLLEAREHIALVVDEWGGTDGVVTMEDVIETLLGLEIVDEGDIAHDMRELAREQWRMRAKALGIDLDRV